MSVALIQESEKKASRQVQVLNEEIRRRLDARAPWKGNAGLIITVWKSIAKRKEKALVRSEVLESST